MRQFFVTVSNSSLASAASVGMLLMSLSGSSAAPGETSSFVMRSNAIAAGIIELPDGGEPCAQFEYACENDSISTEEKAYLYLLKTANPGGTMTWQGPELAVRRLHPEFAMRLAAAIRDARELGLTEAGIYSAYRPPAFGVGGFSDKFNSLHSYGLAVDVHGIGGPGSKQAELWHRVAATHGVACPYGPNHGAEWNHCQPTRVRIIRPEDPLRKTISADGPPNPGHMFEAGNALIESVASVSSSVAGAPITKPEDRDAAQSSEPVRLAKQHGGSVEQPSTRLAKVEDRGATGRSKADRSARDADRAVALASQLARKIKIVETSPSRNDRHQRIVTQKSHLRNGAQKSHAKKLVTSAANPVTSRRAERSTGPHKT